MDGERSQYEVALVRFVDDIRTDLSLLDDQPPAGTCIEKVIARLDASMSRATQLLLPYRAELRELAGDKEARTLASEVRVLSAALLAAKARRAVQFTSLPSDALRQICTHLPARAIVRLCLAYRAAAPCADRSFRTERAASTGLETYSIGDVPMEVLALHEELGATLSPLSPQLAPPDYTAQVGFEIGCTMVDGDLGTRSGVRHSQSRIRAVAAALQRHPAATAVIDTHVGRGAPSDVAVSYCLNRGAVLAAILVWYHQIAVERLVVRAWGKRLNKHARRSSHPNGDASRAGYGWGELFLRLEGTEVPARPDYYGHGVDCAQEIGGRSDGGALASKVSDAAATLRAAHRLSAASKQPSSDEDDEDDDSDEEEEDDEEEEEEVDE